MRLSRSDSVAKSRKGQKSRNKFKGKIKQKRLDAICEKSYNRSHKGVPKVDSLEFNDVGNELELRRSNRARRAPVLLDSSPLPPKKRQKIDRNGSRSIEKGRKIFGVEYESPCSSSRELDGTNGAWGSRLRFRGKSTSFSGRDRGESSSRGKRKLFEDSDGFKDDIETQNHHNKEELVVEKSTVVKPTRPGRIKASNVLENEKQDIDLGGGVECDKEKNRDEVFELMDERDELQLENIVEIRSEIRVKDGNMVLDLDEREDASVQKESELEEGHSNGNVETGEEKIEVEKLASDLVPEQRDVVEVDCGTSGQAKDDGYLDKPSEVKTHVKLKGKDNVLSVADRKPRIKLGRRCGLCGGGIDGKPPKILLLDGTGSDNEAYSGSSASEEPNYDIWDGFGDESGWLGRLLGPINDRLGIAGIWVHQQCAVWSPEVYFAGLGCLKNIRAALYRGRMLKCNRCRRPGATIGCRVDRCPKTYHLPCARARGCIFDHRKFLIACTDHRHLFQPHEIQNVQRLKKMKAKKMKLEMRKIANDAYRKDIEVEEKWLENCGEDEEFLKRESKRFHRDLWRIAPVYIGGTNSKSETKFLGWESVAGLQHVIQCMKEVVILPLLYPEFFKNLGLTPPRGVLLHGYPGTGKTLVVRALVGSCARGDKRIAYFARKGADCLGKYVGDAERQLRLLFQVAEKSQPSIIFFDEIDGLAPCRTKQQDQTHSSVVSTLLALMDGLKSRGSVIVIGATNRPEAVDPALRRPGRFDREIYFPLPSVKDREAILSLHTQKWPKPINGSVLKWIAKRTVGFAGADLQALCTQAAIIALRRSFPLQEVLLAAETKDSHSKFPPIPSFSVEERDWLQAFSCAPPPCSQREGGVVVNDVVSSPLDTHLIPCLLQPLTRLLALLYVDERIWLPPPLNNASTLIKDVIVSALDRRRVQSNCWWLHIDDLLQEVDVKDEIVKNLSLANILVGGTMPCSSIVIEDDSDETCSNFFSPDFKGMGAHSGFLRNMSYAASHKSGFQVLISGNPRCGQRHLASCLLHCFVGNVDVWKIDLASISQEGHGDMVNGLTRILIRCAGANLCMIYMPRIDLWALETYNEAKEGHCESSLMEPQSFENISLERQCKIAMEHVLSPSAEAEVSESEAAVKESYLWTLFSEQVESMGVNTSLIILGTSELPFPLLPPRIRQFFRSDVVNKSSSIPLVHKVSRFSVELDGKFDNDMVIDSFAAKLSKDLMQQFVVSFHGRNHVRDNSFKEKAFDTVEGDVCHGKSNSIHPPSPVPFTKKNMKGKSTLLLAISSVGYQILCYPHFAELCWVTSKLKEGPCANINGPWKCWPFNSCILRPINSAEKAATVSGIKSKESGLVRGLVSVGLSAYRGEYSSLWEVCSEVRKVLEILVGRIDDKIQAGKDQSQFMRLLSQVAYLEDMVINWAQALQSLEVDSRISDATANICVGSSDNDVCKDSISEGNGLTPEVFDRTIDVPNLSEESPHEIGVNEAVQSDLINGDDGCLNAGDEAMVNGNVPSQLVVMDHSSPNKHNSLPNEVLEFNKTESAGDQAGFGGGIVASCKLFNGPKQSDDYQADGSCGSGDEHCDKLQSDDFQVDGPCGSGDEHCDKFSSAKDFYRVNGLASTDNNILFKDNCENVGSNGLEVNYALKSTSFTSGSFVTCFYQCCSECFVNLQKLLLKIIKIEWGLDGSILTVEDVHDLVSSLSANLHLTLSKLSRAECLYGRTPDSKCKKCICHKCGEIDKSECKDLEKRLMIECDCHAKSKNITEKEGCCQISGRLDSSFIFRDGVLVTLDEGTDISYHCKFEKLCLCFLIEWLAMSKEPFD